MEPKNKNIVVIGDGSEQRKSLTGQAVIFAAGRGTRMGALTKDKPKLLLELLGIPVLEHNMKQLNNLVDEVILVVGYKGEMIQKYFGRRYEDLEITYAWQREQLGTGNAAKQALPFLRDRCLFMNGDDLYARHDLKKLLQKYPSILVAKAEHPERFAVVETKGGEIVSLIEKPEHPKGNLVSIGAYFLDPSIFRRSIKKSKRGEYEFTDYVKQWIKRRKLYFVVAKTWIPITSPESLKEAEQILQEKA